MSFDNIHIGYIQVDHRCGDISMAKELFHGDDIDSLFKQMRGIAVTKGVQVDFLYNAGCFERFRHQPVKCMDAVAPIGLLAVKEIIMRLFNFNVFL